MITIRKSEERGHADHGWLDTYHTFSFAGYFDPRHMGFRTLRVINEDRVSAGQGFGTHPHRDMEIISYVLEGGLAHRDSMGNAGIIHPGEVQVMTAGKGITHSEFNHSESELTHFLQIWLLPDREGLEPRYDQRLFSEEEKRDRLKLIVSGDGRDGTLQINQDADVYASILSAGRDFHFSIIDGRGVWLHAIYGKLWVNGVSLKTGDAVAVEGEDSMLISADDDSEFLLFDLA